MYNKCKNFLLENDKIITGILSTIFFVFNSIFICCVFYTLFLHNFDIFFIVWITPIILQLIALNIKYYIYLKNISDDLPEYSISEYDYLKKNR